MTVLSLALKGALVLSLAGIAVHLLRRSPAAARHAVWVAAFVALLVLPLFAAYGPTLAIPVLPETVAQQAAPVVAPAARPAPSPPVAPLAPVGVPLLLEPPPAPVSPEPAVAPEPLSSPTVAPAAAPVAPERSGVAAMLSRVRPSHALLRLWAGGALLVLLGWMLPLVAAWHLVRRARPETSDTWLDALEHARLLSAVEGPVRLLRSDRLDVPVAWGWGTPAVVLPADADEWDEDRRRAVLLHELAHLARGDAQTQIVAQTAVALHWFDPLAWWAYGQMLVEREHACDDAVLRGGARPSAYAGHLVEIASGLQRRPAALAGFAPMARHSRLEGRVRSILSDHQRAALTRLRVAGVAVGALALTIPLAACTLTSRTSEAPAPAVAPRPAPSPRPAPTVAATAEAERAMEAAAEALAEAETAWDDIEIDDLNLDDFDIEVDLREARRSLAEARRRHPDADVEWGEIEAELAEVEVEAEEALAEARATLAEMDLEKIEAEIEAALHEAKHDLNRAMQDLRRELSHVERAEAERAAEREHSRLREGRLRESDVERQRAREARQRAREQERRQHEEARRQAEEARRQADRARATARVTSEYRGPSAPPGYSFGFTQRDGNVTVVAGNGAGAWAESLASWRVGLESIAGQAAEAEGERQIATLRLTLSGLETGLNGLERSGRSWAKSATERRLVSEAIGEARAALATATDELEANATCDDG